MTAHNALNGYERKVVRHAMNTDLLTKERELDLATRWHDYGDPQALKDLTEAYLRLSISIARKFRHYGLPQADLIQEGTVGLLEAARRFDPARDVRFSTYATWWVRASIQDYVLRNWSIVRTGTTAAHKALFFNLRRLKTKLGLHKDAPMSLEDRQKVASEIGVRVLDVEMMDGRLSGVDSSLNTMIAGERTQEWQDLLVSDAPRPDEIIEKSMDASKVKQMLEKAMSSLNERESYIIENRRLCDETQTLSALGERLGVSKERVRQLENQALRKLKDALLNVNVPSY
ncbi:RNA polymerase factor sigma-32 [Kordiimonas sediminis]|nr:RNA polymerase factor sigma-32 [Kordiimonas sediminis]